MVAVTRQSEDVSIFSNDIRTRLVCEGAHVGVLGHRSRCVREGPDVAVLAVDRGRDREDDFLVYLIGDIGRMGVKDELPSAGTLDNMRPLTLSIWPELAARLLGQDDPLVLPSRQVLG